MTNCKKCETNTPGHKRKIFFRFFNSRQGFTLIEVMVVMAIMALIAVMVVPKNVFFSDPPLRALRKSVAELSEMALNGHNLRLRLEPVERLEVGRVVAEAFVKEEDPFSPGKFELKWVPVGLDNPIEGEAWHLSPEIIYFYTDGSCTPARVTSTEGAESSRPEDGEYAVLTVTGFLFEPPEA